MKANMIIHNKTAAIDPLIPIDAGAELLGVSKWTLRRYMREGIVPFYRLGKKTLKVRTSDIEDYLKSIKGATRSRLLS